MNFFRQIIHWGVIFSVVNAWSLLASENKKRLSRQSTLARELCTNILTQVIESQKISTIEVRHDPYEAVYTAWLALESATEKFSDLTPKEQIHFIQIDYPSLIDQMKKALIQSQVSFSTETTHAEIQMSEKSLLVPHEILIISPDSVPTNPSFNLLVHLAKISKDYGIRYALSPLDNWIAGNRASIVRTPKNVTVYGAIDSFPTHPVHLSVIGFHELIHGLRMKRQTSGSQSIFNYVFEDIFQHESIYLDELSTIIYTLDFLQTLLPHLKNRDQVLIQEHISESLHQLQNELKTLKRYRERPIRFLQSPTGGNPNHSWKADVSDEKEGVVIQFFFDAPGSMRLKQKIFRPKDLKFLKSASHEEILSGAQRDWKQIEEFLDELEYILQKTAWKTTEENPSLTAEAVEEMISLVDRFSK